MSRVIADSSLPEDDDVIESILDGVTDICFDTSLNHVLSENTRAGFTETNINIRRSLGTAERTLPTQVLLNELQFRASLISSLIGLSAEELSAIEKDFVNQRQTLIPSVERNKEAIVNAIEGQNAETRNWLSDFFTDMEQQLILVKSTATMDELQRYFQFYMMDTSKTAIATCLKIHAEILQKQVIDISKSLQKEVVIAEMKKIDSSIAERIPDISWTGVDSAMFLMEFSYGYVLENFLVIPIPVLSVALGAFDAVFSVLGYAVAGFFRQGIIDKRQEEYLTPVLREFGEIKRSVYDGADGIYDNIKRDALEKIDSFYQSQVDIAIDAVSHAKSLLIKEQNNREEFKNRLDNILERVAGYQRMLGNG
jgi:hypothetical protein